MSPADEAAERLRSLLREPAALVGTVDLPSYTAALLRLYDVTKERDAARAEVESLKSHGRALVKEHKGCTCQGHGLCGFCVAACDMLEAMRDLG